MCAHTRPIVIGAVGRVKRLWQDSFTIDADTASRSAQPGKQGRNSCGNLRNELLQGSFAAQLGNLFQTARPGFVCNESPRLRGSIGRWGRSDRGRSDPSRCKWAVRGDSTGPLIAHSGKRISPTSFGDSRQRLMPSKRDARGLMDACAFRSSMATFGSHTVFCSYGSKELSKRSKYGYCAGQLSTF
jgi:hypothetical protein